MNRVAYPLLIRSQSTLLVFRADAKVGTRPTLVDAASGRAGASVPRINPANFRAGLIILLLIAGNGSAAQQPDDILARYANESKASATGFVGFDAQTGERFFQEPHGDWSCATCHTNNPMGPGRHAVTSKAIAPLAPSANPERFTDARKTEKWFRRNCNDVLKRACTPREKGDVLAYLLSLQQVKP